MPISAEDIEACEASYRGTDEEEADVIKFAVAHGGDITDVLASVIGARDEDVPRYVAMLERALVDGRLPAGCKTRFDASRDGVRLTAELDGEGISLEEEDEEDDEDEDEDEDEEEESDEDDDEEDDDEEEDDDDEQAVESERVDDAPDVPDSSEVPASLLAMFQQRDAARARGFDAFAAKWEKREKDAARAKPGKAKRNR